MILRPPAPATIAEALRVLRAGGVVCHATETCYGLACDLTNPAAVAKLFAIKKRPHAQPVSALFSSVDDAKGYVEWTERAEELAAKYLPGPLTLILPMRQDPPHALYPIPAGNEERANEQRTLGIRVSSHPLARELAEGFRSPLSTTSANIHSELNPYDAQSILARFEDEDDRPDLIIDSGTLPPVPPSTVMDLTKNGNILREGDLANSSLT